MERIVVGVDGSDGSRAALEWAIEEARLWCCHVEAVMTWHEPYAGGTWAIPIPVDYQVSEASYRARLDAVIEASDTSGLPAPVERVLARGGAGPVLLDRAEGADLLVVGSRGHGGFVGLLLGSVSRQVAMHAPCPAVVVRGEESGPAAPVATTGRLVVGIDGSEGSLSALHWAGEEAAKRGVPLHVVHAWQPPYATMDLPLPADVAGQAADAARSRLDAAIADVGAEVEITAAAVEGPAALSLLVAAKEADLVVVGSRGHGGLMGLLLGSVSHHVVAHAPCPVAVVHPAAPARL